MKPITDQRSAHARRLVGAVVLTTVVAVSMAAPQEDPIVPTTIEDFFMPGSQPPADNPVPIDAFVGASEGHCVNCHAEFAPEYAEAEPYRNWTTSMMAQAGRDPLYLAALTVANQDAGFSGDLCLRCHAPAAWLGGRSIPTDGSGLTEPADFEGETCHFCHRMVDPVYVEGQSPLQDLPIIGALVGAGLLPAQPGSGRYVLDPDGKVRRGPLDTHHPQGAEAILSPFHSASDFCATCHDVSNPALSRQEDGSYLPNSIGAPHPTMDKRDMFPVERTYSEWSESDFARGGVPLEGRFGGNHATGVMESCQDCHMPDRVGPAAANGPVYDDAPQHIFHGGTTWLLDAIRSIHPDEETGLTPEFVQAAQARSIELLRAASDLEVTVEEDELAVTIINYSGHKLPTGYPEGRRMWINVRFLDADDDLLLEHGAYDPDTGELVTDDTKVYEARLGIDEAMAEITGIPAGKSFHFVLSNTWLKDNRIPPIGFDNAAFEAVQAAPVGYEYEDGQYWDETEYDIPPGAASAVVTVWYQTSAKEYVDFLYEENRTDDRGEVLRDQWAQHGRSAPVDMDVVMIELDPGTPCPADVDGSGDVGFDDLLLVLAAWGPCPDCPEDIDESGDVGFDDLLLVLAGWGPCP